MNIFHTGALLFKLCNYSTCQVQFFFVDNLEVVIHHENSKSHKMQFSQGFRSTLTVKAFACYGKIYVFKSTKKFRYALLKAAQKAIRL